VEIQVALALCGSVKDVTHHKYPLMNEELLAMAKPCVEDLFLGMNN